MIEIPFLPVGTEFCFRPGIWLRVEESALGICNCYFNDSMSCIRRKCNSFEREDETQIIFKQINENERHGRNQIDIGVS